jgi:hypothetical protein
MNHNFSIPPSVLTLSAALLLLPLVASCSKEEPPPPPVSESTSSNFQENQFTAPRPEPQRPTIELAQGVTFPETLIPSDEPLAQSIATLASALKTGDVQSMSTVLTKQSQSVLNSLVETGQWAKATQRIQQVRIVTVTDASDAPQVGIGIQESGQAYLLAWEGSMNDGLWQFDGLAIEPRTVESIDQLDGTLLALRALPSAAPLEEIIEPEATDPRREQAQENNSSGSRKRTTPTGR